MSQITLGGLVWADLPTGSTWVTREFYEKYLETMKTAVPKKPTMDDAEWMMHRLETNRQASYDRQDSRR